MSNGEATDPFMDTPHAGTFMDAARLADGGHISTATRRFMAVTLNVDPAAAAASAFLAERRVDDENFLQLLAADRGGGE